VAAHVVLGCLLLRFGTLLILAWLTTNHERRNLPHHSKSCSNHNIETHHGHLTSRQMEDQHSQHSTQAKLNIIKMERLLRWLKAAGLSNITNHKNPILKYEGLDNKLMHAASVYYREKAYWNKMIKGHLPCPPAGYCSKSWKSSSWGFTKLLVPNDSDRKQPMANK
jgi:hypothetical protein